MSALPFKKGFLHPVAKCEGCQKVDHNSACTSAEAVSVAINFARKT